MFVSIFFLIMAVAVNALLSIVAAVASNARGASVPAFYALAETYPTQR
jgi:hypothetical protein